MNARVEMREASKWYGPVIGVNDVSIDVGPGVTGLLGPNGAGKSTLMKLIVGELKPSIGRVRVLGKAAWSSPRVRRAVGFMPEGDIFYEEMKALEFVLAMARLSGLGGRRARSCAGLALERTGMTAHAEKKLRACSKGMRQRIKIAQALVHDPEVLVLDEPLSGIDPAGRIELMRLIGELGREGKTVLVSTHILHEVERITDRIILMARGRILAAGTLGRIRELLEEYPLTVRLTTNRRREMAAALMARDFVVAVSLGEAESVDGSTGAEGSPEDRGDLTVKVLRPEDFFRELPEILLTRELEVTRVEALDASAEAIFQYLVRDSGSGLQGEVS